MEKTGGNDFAVIGLGRFGASLALTLIERGYHVMGIDVDRGLVQQFADALTHTVALDASDEEALQAIDIGSFDTVVVSMGEHFESSVLATVALKKMGVRQVICKALTERQGEILERVGADRVILPEREAGQRLALELTSPQIIDSMVLGPGHAVSEVELPGWLAGRTLAESSLTDRFGVTVLVVQSGEALLIAPPPEYVFRPGDLLVIVGPVASVERLSRGR